MKFALAAYIALVLAGPAFAGDAAVKASADSGLDEVSHISAVHNLSDERSHVMVRVFESGGGDPAMNGNRLLFAIVPDPQQKPRIWETGIDVYIVRRVALDAERSQITIDVTEHFQGDGGGIRQRPGIYTLHYDIDPENGAVSETIRVSKD